MICGGSPTRLAGDTTVVCPAAWPPWIVQPRMQGGSKCNPGALRSVSLGMAGVMMPWQWQNGSNPARTAYLADCSPGRGEGRRDIQCHDMAWSWSWPYGRAPMAADAHLPSYCYCTPSFMVIPSYICMGDGIFVQFSWWSCAVQ